MLSVRGVSLKCLGNIEINFGYMETLFTFALVPVLGITLGCVEMGKISLGKLLNDAITRNKLTQPICSGYCRFGDIGSLNCSITKPDFFQLAKKVTANLINADVFFNLTIKVANSFVSGDEACPTHIHPPPIGKLVKTWFECLLKKDYKQAKVDNPPLSPIKVLFLITEQ